MASTLTPPRKEADYEADAIAYCTSLPLEHFMESKAQATQREITLASLALVRARRPDVHVFSEMLVQYPLPDGEIGKVVPDNMVVVSDEIEVGLLDGWVRFWHRKKLLPLPAELLAEKDEAEHTARLERRQKEESERRANQLSSELAAEREARMKLEEEIARLRAAQRPSASGRA